MDFEIRDKVMLIWQCIAENNMCAHVRGSQFTIISKVPRVCPCCDKRIMTRKFKHKQFVWTAFSCPTMSHGKSLTHAFGKRKGKVNMLKQGNKQKEAIVNLKDVGIGKVFRFASEDFSECLTTNRFFMRVNPNGEKARVRCVSVEGTEIRDFDDNHSVVVNQHEMVVYP